MAHQWQMASHHRSRGGKCVYCPQVHPELVPPSIQVFSTQQCQAVGRSVNCEPVKMLASCIYVSVLTIAITYRTMATSADTDMIFQDIAESRQMSPSGQDNNKPAGCECMPFYLCKNNSVVDYYGEDVIDIRFGASECTHYMDKCCISPAEPVKPSPQPFTTYIPSCGAIHSDGVGFKITGNSDNEANYGEFPWMVALLRKDNELNGLNPKKLECGGSLIHPQVVLTGAHCVKRKKHLYVRAGEWDTKTEKEIYPTQEREVKTTIIHEEYYAGGLHNDIALLVLESPFLLSEVVDTICLPEKGEVMDGRHCIVTGWGKDSFGKEGKYQEILKRVELPIVSREPCQAILRTTSLGREFKLHKSFLCAGGELGKDACKGDGGGPLVCPSKASPSTYLQAGMVAWGVGCGNAIPAVYVNIPYFRPWIDDKMRSLHFI